MGDFPTKDKLCIHFAHPAYRLAETFAARNTGIAHFQTETIDETRARIGEGDVFVASGFWRNEFLADAPKLKFIQVCAVGYDQVDLEAVRAKGVRLANSAGVNANAVSDHALALILGLTRQIHVARDNQRRPHWRPMIADIPKREDELPGKTILIYGAGRIGERIARLAKAFDMTALGVRRNAAEKPAAFDEMHAPDAFLSLLPRADIVVLACPLTPETRGLMNAAAFKAMKDTGYFINVARGGCADQDDLIEALRSGVIAGAGIDVTEPEPLPADSPLWGFDNAIITPHTGGETQRYEANVIDALLENLDRLAAGRDDLLNQIV